MTADEQIERKKRKDGPGQGNAVISHFCLATADLDKFRIITQLSPLSILDPR